MEGVCLSDGATGQLLAAALMYSRTVLDEAIASVEQMAGSWKFPLASGISSTVGAFFVELLRWNRRINLTGARDLQDLVEEHLCDSFALAKLVPSGVTLVDVGSGGGLPAVPFAALRPDTKVCLVEPRAKRVAFLRGQTRPLPSLEVVHGRWEDLGERRFEVACSRATFSPLEWIEIGVRLVNLGGRVLVLASAPCAEVVARWRVEKALEYSTGRRVMRWAGCYCST